MPHATSCELDWPFTPKGREKKPAASSRRRSHIVYCNNYSMIPRQRVFVRAEIKLLEIR
jgi:hypothetical protein